MKIYALETGKFKIDAGPMFGVIPKSMWAKVCPSDDNNMCTLANRCLLAVSEERVVLIDAGVGNKVSEKLVKQTQYETGKDIVYALKEKGFAPEEVTDVIFTHLHYDHCGGAVDYNGDDRHEFRRVFPNATHHISRRQWEWALTPNRRESAAYPPEYIVPMEDFDLHLVEEPGEILPGIEIVMCDGHTPGQMIPVINAGAYKIAFGGDLVPSSAHVPLLWISAYDVFPLTVIEEKERFLKRCTDEGIYICFEHDPVYEAALLQHGARGAEIKETLTVDKIQSKHNAL